MLKTRVMMLKIQICIIGINYIVKYEIIKNSYIKLLFNITVFTVFLIK